MARFAIGDIHGCSKTFQKLIEEKLCLTKDDRVYLLGDLVNKGPDSKSVLDYIMFLKKEKFDIIALRGNHDQMLIDAYYGRSSSYWLTEHAEPKTLQSFGVNQVGDVPIKYIEFLKEMPFFMELEETFLVHAGLNFELNDPFSDFKAMLYLRKFEVKPEKLKGKTLIHGHVPISFDKIKQSISRPTYEINIDSGCVYYLNEGLGLLTALNLDTFELITQYNVDQPYFIDVKK